MFVKVSLICELSAFEGFWVELTDCVCLMAYMTLFMSVEY